MGQGWARQCGLWLTAPLWAADCVKVGLTRTASTHQGTKSKRSETRTVWDSLGQSALFNKLLKKIKRLTLFNKLFNTLFAYLEQSSGLGAATERRDRTATWVHFCMK